jgi:hypothetical protein
MVKRLAESRPSAEQGSPGLLLAVLELHAADSLEKNATNAKYAESVRLRAQQASALITSKSGEVKSLVASWVDDVQPVVETVFGMDLSGHQIGEHEGYMPTVFKSVYGRIRIISTDEIFGPVLALDLAAEDCLPERTRSQ